MVESNIKFITICYVNKVLHLNLLDVINVLRSYIGSLGECYKKRHLQLIVESMCIDVRESIKKVPAEERKSVTRCMVAYSEFRQSFARCEQECDKAGANKEAIVEVIELIEKIPEMAQERFN